MIHKSKLTIGIPASAADHLDEIALKTGISKTDLVRIFIRSGLEAIERGEGVTLSGSCKEEEEVTTH